MTTTTRDRDQTHQHLSAAVERLKLLGFTALMALAGLGLWAAGGPPRLPSELPHPQQLGGVLTGSTLPIRPLALLMLDVAWLLWVWIVGSFGLESLVLLVESMGRGAAWVRSLRHVADRVTLPLARRAVAAAFAVQVLSRGVPLAAAAPLPTPDVALVADVSPTFESGASSAAGASQPAASSRTYVVRPGDTLWSIAEDAYGSGTAYRRLVDANVGRRMVDGKTFSPQGVIQPGWELVVPEPTASAPSGDQVDGQDWYTVEAHDTLSAVAASTLGDQERWPDLFEANRGAVTQDGRHTLSDPNLIWPGLRLRLPDAPPAPAATTEPTQSDQADRADLVAAHAMSSSDPALAVRTASLFQHGVRAVTPGAGAAARGGHDRAPAVTAAISRDQSHRRWSSLAGDPAAWHSRPAAHAQGATADARRALGRRG